MQNSIIRKQEALVLKEEKKSFYQTYLSKYGVITGFAYLFWVIFGPIHYQLELSLISGEQWWYILISLWLIIAFCLVVAGILVESSQFIFVKIPLHLFKITKKFFTKDIIRMFNRFSFNNDVKKFAGLTRNLSSEQYINLKLYFKSMNIDNNSAVNFLDSCRGIAFIEEYSKHQNLTPSEISKIIIDTERSGQILACAQDILKGYDILNEL